MTNNNRRNIQDIVNEVNKSLDESQELTGTQRNALMLVHLVTTVEEVSIKVDDSNKRIANLEEAMKKDVNDLAELARRVKILEDNSVIAIVRTILVFIRDNPKLLVYLLLGLALAFGATPEIIKIFAAYVGLEVP